MARQSRFAPLRQVRGEVRQATSKYMKQSVEIRRMEYEPAEVDEGDYLSRDQGE